MSTFTYSAIEGLYRLQDIKKKRRLIRSISELDRLLREAELSFAESSEKGLASLERLRFSYEIPKTLRPDSEAYKKFQMELYYEISGRANYDPYINEHSPFDLASAMKQPYPYSTHSPRTRHALATHSPLTRHALATHCQRSACSTGYDF